MSNEIDEVKAKIDALPKDLKKEVLNYIDFLLQKRVHSKNQGNFSFDWEGSLSELREEFTSVELQHKASKWR